MLKILIVEDDKFISAIISFFIKDLGHLVFARCQSGAHALEACERERPDVALMDIHLEGELDGIQTAERLQRDYEIPVIFISSDTSSNVVERAIIANSYGYLVKPVQKKELGITIDLAYYKHKVTLDQKRREQSFRQFISEAPIPMIIIVDKRIQYLNMSALDLFHSHYIEDIIGLPFIDFVSNDSVKQFDDLFESSFQIGKKIERFDATFKGLHCKEIDVVVNGSWIRFNNKDALQLILADISSEKLALREALVMREIVYSGYGAVLELGDDFKVLNYNLAFDTLVKYDKDLRGSSIFEATSIIKTDKDQFKSASKQKQGVPFYVELITPSHIMKCKVFQVGILCDKPKRFILSVTEISSID